MGAETAVRERPKRIQRKRSKGWRMPPGALYVGRPTVWGNPYKVGDRHPILGATISPGQAARLFRDLLLADISYLTWTQRVPSHLLEWREAVRFRLHLIRGKDLACWCPEGAACHADVLIELSNR